jgi:hypothetical protein
VAGDDRHRLRRVAVGAALGHVGVALGFCRPLAVLDREDRGRQGGLAVVDVTDGAHVDVGLGAGKYFLRHCVHGHQTSTIGFEPIQSSFHAQLAT